MGAGGKGLITKLQENTALFRGRMKEAGFDIKVLELSMCYLCFS